MFVSVHVCREVCVCVRTYLCMHVGMALDSHPRHGLVRVVLRFALGHPMLLGILAQASCWWGCFSSTSRRRHFSELVVTASGRVGKRARANVAPQCVQHRRVYVLCLSSFYLLGSFRRRQHRRAKGHHHMVGALWRAFTTYSLGHMLAAVRVCKNMDLPMSVFGQRLTHHFVFVVRLGGLELSKARHRRRHLGTFVRRWEFAAELPCILGYSGLRILPLLCTVAKLVGLRADADLLEADRYQTDGMTLPCFAC